MTVSINISEVLAKQNMCVVLISELNNLQVMAQKVQEERDRLYLVLKALHWRGRKEFADPEDIHEMDAADRLLCSISPTVQISITKVEG
jgi:hypothetical protein